MKQLWQLWSMRTAYSSFPIFQMWATSEWPQPRIIAWLGIFGVLGLESERVPAIGSSLHNMGGTILFNFMRPGFFICGLVGVPQGDRVWGNGSRNFDKWGSRFAFLNHPGRMYQQPSTASFIRPIMTYWMFVLDTLFMCSFSLSVSQFSMFSNVQECNCSWQLPQVHLHHSILDLWEEANGHLACSGGN